MCTVTYLPLHQNGFILTSNRDEDILRPAAIPVKKYVIENRAVYFPKDPKANGTWIAQDKEGYTLCLLNGAYEKHKVKSTYKKSRGLVLLDFYKFESPENYAVHYDFSGIEPFTMVMVYACPKLGKVLLYELKWDEKEANLTAYDSTLPHIWSSVTLYTPAIIQERKTWFCDWLNSKKINSTEGILSFHHFGGKGNIANDLVIDRGQKRTVSICCIHRTKKLTKIIYEDIINQNRVLKRI